MDIKKFEKTLLKIQQNIIDNKLEHNRYKITKIIGDYGVDIKLNIFSDKRILYLNTNLKDKTITIFLDKKHIKTFYKNDSVVVSNFIKQIKKEKKNIDNILDEIIKDLDNPKFPDDDLVTEGKEIKLPKVNPNKVKKLNEGVEPNNKPFWKFW